MVLIAHDGRNDDMLEWAIWCLAMPHRLGEPIDIGSYEIVGGRR